MLKSGKAKRCFLYNNQSNRIEEPDRFTISIKFRKAKLFEKLNLVTEFFIQVAHVSLFAFNAS